MKRTTAFILVLVILLPLFCGCGRFGKPDAIIILPGIMGSELFLTEDTIYEGKEYEKGTALWITLDSIEQIVAVRDHIAMLAPESGCSIEADTPIVNYYHVNQNYGALNTYGALYKALYDEFGEECDVVFYSYDWREDPYATARELDRFINSQGYDRVSIVAHSMGGLVASHFFAMGEEQRKMTDTYLSLGTPYLGSAQAAYAMITGNIDSFFANLLVSGEAKEICPKLESMYALLPYAHLWQKTLSVYSLTGVTDADSFSSEKELLAEYAENYSDAMHVGAEEKKSLLFDSEGRHVSELVNSYYLVGSGEKTVISLRIPNDAKLAAAMTAAVKDEAGDGTVSLYSATVGGTLPSDRVFVKRGDGEFEADHVSLADGSDPTNISFIIAVLRGKADSLGERDLVNEYNIKKGIPKLN